MGSVPVGAGAERRRGWAPWGKEVWGTSSPRSCSLLVIVKNHLVRVRKQLMQTQPKNTKSHASTQTYRHNLYPDERGRFGPFGGKFVPESLLAALADLKAD